MMTLKDWVNKWKAFLIVIFDPWTVSLVLLVVFFGIVLVKQTDPVVVTALTLIITIVSGALGGLLTNRWTAVSEEKVIVARGKAAVRSLRLLLGNISALDRRVREYLKRYTDEKNRKLLNEEVIRTYLEEIIGRCDVLEEETLGSVENWGDIIPEADVNTQIGVITELREEVVQRTKEYEDLNSQLNDVRGKSKDKEDSLKKEIQEKEQKIRALRMAVITKSRSVGSRGISIGSSGELGSTITIGATKKCQSCGHEYEALSITGLSTCPRCHTIVF